MQNDKLYNNTNSLDKSKQQGVLYIIATPIGNLADITQRAIDTLAMVDKICAEDTRNTRKLLSHLGLKKNLQALHEHNEIQKTNTVLQWLKAGQNIALVSDAGTPLISDPGYFLVKTLREENFRIIPIPGASAIITALSAAGLPTDKFLFAGFLPAKKTARKQVLLKHLKTPYTQIYYESSHRIVDTINTMLEVFGTEKKVVLARELTKLYEQFFYGSLERLYHWLLENKKHQKGEFVIMLAGEKNTEKDSENINCNIEQMLTVLIKELPLKQAAKIASKITGKNKNTLYKQGLKLK